MFPRPKIKLKARHYNATQVIKAESQEVLNILTEYDFHEAFKKWQKRWEWCIHMEREYLEGYHGQ
jgi:hypothetical protein